MSAAANRARKFTKFFPAKTAAVLRKIKNAARFARKNPPQNKPWFCMPQNPPLF